MKNHPITFIYFLLICSLFTGCKQEAPLPLEHTFTITSNILNEERTCLIKLPTSYNEATASNKNYPILILLDGSSHFKITTTAVKELSSEINSETSIAETIIVAIENTDRERDFTVTKIKTRRTNTTGGGKNFMSFMEEELLPYLDKNYRTRPNRTLIGHSLGGLFTLNVYLDKNSAFNSFISIDPSIWWDEDTMQRKVDSFNPVYPGKKLYIATANQGEANYERNKKRHDLFYTLIQNKAAQGGHLYHQYFEDEDHRSIPEKAIYEGLRFLNK